MITCSLPNPVINPDLSVRQSLSLQDEEWSVLEIMFPANPAILLIVMEELYSSSKAHCV